MDKSKKQRGDMKGHRIVNLGNSKPDAPSSTGSGDNGGGGPGGSGGWNGGMKGKARQFEPCPFCGKCECNPRFCPEGKRAVEEMKK